MNIAISGNTRNHIFIAVLAVVLLCLITAFSIAGEQDKVNKNNYIHYQQAINLINHKKYGQAEIMLKQLDTNYQQQAFQVQEYLGLCALSRGNYTEAARYMNKAQEIRPALLTDQIFLVKYGELLYMQNEYSRAKIYLLESKKYNKNPDIAKEAEKYLGQIEIKEKGREVKPK